MPIYEVWVKAHEITEVDRLYIVEAETAEEAERIYDEEGDDECDYQDSYNENLIEVRDIEVLKVIKYGEED